MEETMNLKGTSRLLAVSALAGTLFLGVACSGDDDDSDTPSTGSGTAVTQPTSVNGDSSSDANFAAEVQNELTELQDELAAVEAEASSMDDSARAEVEPMIEELRTTITTLENRLIDLQAAADGPDRDAVKAEIEDTLALARAQIDELQATVGI
jgi:septal ring factor EnvC (AmiA/AmiB activator)